MKNLNLIVLRCRDIAVTAGFYSVLGLKFERHKHGSGPGHYASEDESGVFELYPADVPDNVGLGFRSAGLDELANRLRDLGMSPSAPKDNPWGRSFVARDPDGRRVEIVQQV